MNHIEFNLYVLDREREDKDSLQNFKKRLIECNVSRPKDLLFEINSESVPYGIPETYRPIE